MPKLPPPPPFKAQNRSGVGAGVGDAHRAVGRHHLGLDQAGGRQAVALGEGAEAAALDQAGHAHRGAAAALHVAAGLGDRVVGVQPHHAGAQRHRRLRAIAAALADKGVVQLDAVHGARPHQQRIGRVGRPLIGVTAALHGQPQAMGAREVDRGRDVGRIARGHGVGAGGRRPGIGPAAGLGQGDAVADQPRVLQAFEEGGALGTGRRGAAGIERRLDLDELAADPGVQLLPLVGRRPGRISGTAAALGILGVGGRHQGQTSGEHHELASVHGGSSRWRLLIAAEPAMMPRIVTTGTAGGTTGGRDRTTGQRSIDRRPAHR